MIRESGPEVGWDQPVFGVVVRGAAGRQQATSYEPVPRPTLGPADLLIRPHFVGVCGTDVKLVAGGMDTSYSTHQSHVLGHEWSGTVVAAGQACTRLAPGSLVVGSGSLGENRWFGVTDDGAMADVFAVPEHLCLAVPASVSAQRAALVEPLACVLQGLQGCGGCDASQTVVVFGCGTIGLAMVGVVRSTGAAVVAVDPSRRRRDLATALGADLALPAGPAEDLTEAIAAAGFGPSADLVVECSGAAAAMTAAIEVAAEHARLLYLGLGHTAAAQVPLWQIHTKDLQISSSTGAQHAIWGPALRLLERTGLDLTPAVSQVYTFDQCEAAMAAAADPTSSGKVMLRPALAPGGDAGMEDHPPVDPRTRQPQKGFDE